MKTLKSIMTFSSVVMLLFVSVNIVQAEERILKVQVALPTFLPVLGKIPLESSKKFNIAAKGIIQLDWQNRKGLGKPWDIFDQIEKGTVDATFSFSHYFTIGGKLPHTEIFAMFPFSGDEMEFIAWLKYGGGSELYQEAIDKEGYNIKVIHPCLIVPPEGGGWYNKEINRPSKLKGIKIRTNDINVALVFEKMGAETTSMGPMKIAPAVKKGEINAAEFNVLQLDIAAGLHKQFKYLYTPSWITQTAAFSLYINKDIWNDFTGQEKALVETFCTALSIEGASQASSLESAALDQIKKEGVIVKTYNKRMMKAFKKSWDKIAKEKMEKSPKFAKYYKHYLDFHDKYQEWSGRAYLPRELEK